MPTEIIDQSKYRVSYNVYFISIICFALISCTTYFGNLVYFTQAVAALVISIFSLVLLTTTKNYKLPVYISISVSIFVHIIGFLTSSFVNNQGDIFWIIVIGIFSYYIVGKIGSIIYLSINIGSLAIINLLVNNNLIELPFKASKHDIISDLNYILNLVACMVLLVYLVGQILGAYEQTQKTLLETNTVLQSKDLEKTTMLKEIHHRVKNNLQVIISLLRLQLFQLDQEDSISGPFQDSINRITTMALIHEKMYKGDKLNNLNVENYISDLASDLVRTYATETKVKVSVSSNIEHLKMDDLVPFSLILNELITNSIKHGFKGVPKGEISIDVRQTTIGFDLTYRDSGTWKEETNDQSFGMELIDTLNGHFDGIYQRHVTDNGTEFTFNLKVF